LEKIENFSLIKKNLFTNHYLCATIKIRTITDIEEHKMPVKYKHSHKRDAILALIRSTTVHPSAEWVYSELKPRYPDLSLGTVYRNLAMLKDNGSLCSVGVVSGEERFDGNTDEHAHFICEDCGTVLDIPEAGPAQQRELEEITGRYGVTISRRLLMYYGRCPACAQAADAAE
jgi:Fur family peroxide stress response transcriptional regulator